MGLFQVCVKHYRDVLAHILGRDNSEQTKTHQQLTDSRVITARLVPAGTHFSRKCFLVPAQRCLAPCNAAGRLSFGDVHSLLQLLCPDFPSSVLKNAWSSAVAVQECKQHLDSTTHSCSHTLGPP
jgi:hypothetical protein